MKTKLAIITSVIFSSLFLLQCNNKTDNNYDVEQSSASGFTKITGYIHNRDFYPNEKEMILNLSHISGKYRAIQIKTPINDDGTFQFEIDLARPQDATMPPHLNFLYLLPNDSLHIEIDFKDLFDVRLSGGKSVEINQDFFKYFDATGYRNDNANYHGVGTDCVINCSWDEIVKQFDEERNLYREKRKEFLQKTNVCDEVIALTESMIELDYYDRFIRAWLKRSHAGKEATDNGTIMNELNEVAAKHFNSGFYSNTHFKFISSAYTHAAAFITQPSEGTKYEDWVNEVAKSDIIKDFMFTVQAGHSLLRRDLNGFENHSSYVSNEDMLARLMQEYRATRNRMLNPENVSSHILGNSKEITGNMSFDGNNLLAKTITPNQGKVQIINISAKWCAPCQIVLAELATLMKEYDGKDVCFSFICITADTKETREKYREKGIDDKIVHFTTDEEYFFISRTFAPIGFPYGILVNKKGVIVDYGTHVRPGTSLQEKINLLLEQDNLVK